MRSLRCRLVVFSSLWNELRDEVHFDFVGSSKSITWQQTHTHTQHTPINSVRIQLKMGSLLCDSWIKMYVLSVHLFIDFGLCFIILLACRRRTANTSLHRNITLNYVMYSTILCMSHRLKDAITSFLETIPLYSSHSHWAIERESYVCHSLVINWPRLPRQNGHMDIGAQR